MTTLYGIKNCDTIKKAKQWLEQNQIEYRFHDYRIDGIEQDWLASMTEQLGWENVLNKRGTTFRQLPQDVKDNVDRDKAIELMLAQPAMIKRPILTHNGQTILGFNAANYAEKLS